MLEAITDFWKPAKKAQPQEKLNPDQLQLSSAIGFGFVPQQLLSGRRLQVVAINTYQFGGETLTSFVLAHDKEQVASMIVAEAEGEHYLAISRRISLNDRMRLFDSRDLENVMTRPEVNKLPCKETGQDFKGWTVANYKREIQGLKGRIFRGDFRKQALPQAIEAQEFDYFLLVSDSNEHAIEIEKYGDGRVEVYSTIYRRMNDVGEISHPPRTELSPPDVKFASGPEAKKVADTPQQPVPAMAAKPELTHLAEPKPAEPVAAPVAEDVAVTTNPATEIPEAITPNPPEENPTMSSSETASPQPLSNGAGKDMNAPAGLTAEQVKAHLTVQQHAPESYLKQEVKAVSNPNLSNFETDSIECDLRVANKIIDEAIRNEMRLTDVVRRIIELPVAYPESVQIPMTLTDEDYALLAIRYGIQAADRNAIKRRILDDLNDFSGEKKAA